MKNRILLIVGLVTLAAAELAAACPSGYRRYCTVNRMTGETVCGECVKDPEGRISQNLDTDEADGDSFESEDNSNLAAYGSGDRDLFITCRDSGFEVSFYGAQNKTSEAVDYVIVGARTNKNKIKALQTSCLHTFPVNTSFYPTCTHKITKNFDPTLISFA